MMVLKVMLLLMGLSIIGALGLMTLAINLHMFGERPAESDPKWVHWLYWRK